MTASKDMREAKREVSRRYLQALSATARNDGYAASQLHGHNITAVGIGRKVTAGRSTDEVAVRVYVRTKLPKRMLGKRAIPSHLDGIATDIIVSGPFRALGEGIATTQAMHRPVRPGVSIGFAHPNRVIAGTLGALVTRNGSTFYLSNNHILAFENALPIGSPIVQPGMRDGGGLPDEKVGELAEFVRLTTSGNHVDAALAAITTPSSLAQPVLRVSIDSPIPVPALEQQRVHKIGRSTGYTIGTIVDVDADIPVRFSSKVYRFDDQILIKGESERFAVEGDSGALVVTVDTGDPVALLFAGSQEFGAANHLTRVAAALGFTIVI